MNDSFARLHGEKGDVFSLGLTLLLDYLSLPQRVLPNPFNVTEAKRKEDIGKLIQMVDDDSFIRETLAGMVEFDV